MTELKFKLKRDGVTVGYARITPGPTGLLHETYREPDDPLDRWWLECPIDMRAYDSIHPFVCLDHHGNEVYEGDVVKCHVSAEPYSDGVAVILQRIRLDLSDGPYYATPGACLIELIADQPQERKEQT
ncbi:MAG: hypothetical protein LLG01_00860 [Planctomycetaceae bacterium]|nr:hypothetical protein [Planctomycetaceae bacterium]